MSTLIAFAMPGTQELLIIGAVAFLLFGSALPSRMRSLGEGIREFKNGVKEMIPEDEAA